MGTVLYTFFSSHQNTLEQLPNRAYPHKYFGSLASEPQEIFVGCIVGKLWMRVVF